MSSYFVMLYSQRNNAVPLVEDDCEPAFFNNIEDAREAAKDNFLGETFGYEIFELGTGDS